MCQIANCTFEGCKILMGAPPYAGRFYPLAAVRRFCKSLPMATPWVPFLNGVVKLLERIEKMQGATRQQRDIAFMAILTASNQTHGYIRATQLGKARDTEREHALSNLWDSCAFHLGPIDADMAMRCRLKGDYWRNPDQWTVEDIKQTRIGLDRVRKEAEYLLRLKIKPVRPISIQQSV